MEKLMTEKASLAAQVKALEEDLEALRRHEGGKTAVILHTKLEDQERQIAQLQLANQVLSREESFKIKLEIDEILIG